MVVCRRPNPKKTPSARRLRAGNIRQRWAKTIGGGLQKVQCDVIAMSARGSRSKYDGAGKLSARGSLLARRMVATPEPMQPSKGSSLYVVRKIMWQLTPQ